METKILQKLDGTIMYYIETEKGAFEVERCKNTRFAPNIGEKFYYITENDDIENKFFFGNDEIKKDTNNCFKTEKEAQRKKEIFDFIYSKRSLFTKMEWEDAEINKHYIYANNVSETLDTTNYNLTIYSPIWFETKEKAREVIDFVGYDDWLKYVLNIYED